MSDKRLCPECNTPLDDDATFCENCGTRVQSPTSNTPKSNNEPKTDSPDAGGDDLSRNNVSGSINKITTTNTSNSQTNNSYDNSTNNTNLTSNVTTNSSSIDNSTVHNNTTIVMGGKSEAEFCEVCGNPFDGKHARCPKCGKSICFDCKVKGKNRCIECEKKAINEYRMAYQELMLTTNGKIGAAGRQMMNRKAQELDVEEKKKSIEEEIDAMYKSETKAQQPEVIAATATATAATENRRTSTTAQQTSKSIGALSDNQPKLQPHNSSSGSSKKWFIIASVVAIVLLAYIIFGGTGDQQAAPEQAAPTQVETVAPAATPQPAAQPAQQKPAATQQKAETTPAKATPAPAPAAQKDTQYEAGMKAYEEGNGLEAVKKFKASGSADSYYMLGVIYESGCGGIAKNAMMARQNFKKAANMGHAKTKAKL